MFSLRSQCSLSMPWNILSTFVLFLRPDYGQKYHLAAPRPTATAWLLSVMGPLLLPVGHRVPRGEQIAVLPHENEGFWISSGSCFGRNTGKMQCGDEVVWQPSLDAGRLTACFLTLLLSEKNECSCCDGLCSLSWGVLSSCLLWFCLTCMVPVCGRSPGLLCLASQTLCPRYSG